MNWAMLGSTVLRYWRMAHDRRTPPIVRGLIYVGIAATVTPKKWHPKNVPGLGLLDEKALVPAVIALAMVLIPKKVREEHEREAERERAEAREALAS